jgi:anthranilate synthase component 2
VTESEIELNTGRPILIIDNYDSFTFNLVQLFGQVGQELQVIRNDATDVAGLVRLKPAGLVVSPGPGTPSDAGICMQAIRDLHQEIPIFGVCLGHQCIGEVFGGRVVRAPSPMHGKTSPVTHQQGGLLAGLSSPLTATRYHSLMVEESSFPETLQIDARADDGTIMALHHRAWPVFGVQFHPESVMTEQGEQIVRNFLGHCGTTEARVQ